jgi:ketosteroid isomerase-like protein
MSRAIEVAEQAYALAKKSKHKELRDLIADDATWQPAKKAKWKPCINADQIVQALLWRAGRANKLRPGTPTIDLGPHVVMQMRGKRLERLGARGFLSPKLFQVVEIKDGKIVRMHDHTNLEEALAATGHES